MLSQEWVFGVVERMDYGKWSGFIEFVPDRSAYTLIEIIKRRVAPRTRIISNGWASYSGLVGLEGYEYSHEVINHNKNFVHPENPDVHTQRVEGFGYSSSDFFETRDHTEIRITENVCASSFSVSFMLIRILLLLK